MSHAFLSKKMHRKNILKYIKMSLLAINIFNVFPIELIDHVIYFTRNKVIELCQINKYINKVGKMIRITDSEKYPFIEDRNLKELINLTAVDSCKISITGLHSIRNLTCLRLKFTNQINDQELIGLTNLTALNLSLNYIITINSIERLPNLLILSLSDNSGLTNEDIRKLTKINDLDLHNNEQITDDGISQLINLTKLDLSYNYEITNKGISNLTNLVSLNLSGNNGITNRVFRALINLTVLDITKNRNIRIDKILPILPNLKTIKK